MATYYKQNMTQDATYWPAGANDGFGGVAFGGAVAVKCRWQDDAKLARDADGNEFTTSSIIYIDQAVAAKGYLAKGAFTGTTPDASAREIRQVYITPNLSGDLLLVKAAL